MKRAFLLSALRTPIALRHGGLSRIRPEHFAASVMHELLHRTGVDGAELDGVFAGNAVGTYYTAELDRWVLRNIEQSLKNDIKRV